jgi:hypothetical protein
MLFFEEIIPTGNFSNAGTRSPKSDGPDVNIQTNPQSGAAAVMARQ